MTWDPAQYDRFRDERRRPFFELMARVEAQAPTRRMPGSPPKRRAPDGAPDGAPARRSDDAATAGAAAADTGRPDPAAGPGPAVGPGAAPRHIVDVGCGTGWTTAWLAQRYPDARVTGVDSSADMLAAAPRMPQVEYVAADLDDWHPAEPVDLLVANAVLHWLPDPQKVYRRLASWVAPGGVLATQVPANHDAASHAIVREAATWPQAAGRLRDVAMGDHVLALDGYARILEDEGFRVDAWETTYRMRLPPGGVLEWLKGTTLRPHLAALGDAAGAWLAALAEALETAYPPDAAGVVYPFTRRFVVARRAASTGHDRADV